MFQGFASCGEGNWLRCRVSELTKDMQRSRQSRSDHAHVSGFAIGIGVQEMTTAGKKLGMGHMVQMINRES